MNLYAINHTIRALCSEVEVDSTTTNWRQLREDELLYEAVVCIFGSQLQYEMAVALADIVRSGGLLLPSSLKQSDFQDRALVILSRPVEYFVDGVSRVSMPRFKNRLSKLLADTITMIHCRGSSLKSILLAADSASVARQQLVEKVAGFGPKQASLYLRRIGYCADLAVLDIHILDYLRLSQGFAPQPSYLSRISSYELIEAEFRDIANDFGFGLGRVDLAMWITMRVAKREARI